MFVCLFVYLPVCLSGLFEWFVCMSVFLPVWLYVCILTVSVSVSVCLHSCLFAYVYMFVCQFVCQHVCRSVCMYLCLSVSVPICLHVFLISVCLSARLSISRYVVESENLYGISLTDQWRTTHRSRFLIFMGNKKLHNLLFICVKILKVNIFIQQNLELYCFN